MRRISLSFFSLFFFSFSQTSSATLLQEIKDKLKLSPTGKQLLELSEKKLKASGRQWKDLVFIEGYESKLETVLIRRFPKDRPWEISYRVEQKIYLSSEGNLYNRIRDLSHELAHFVYQEQENFFVGEIKILDFIQKTIEQEGGEAHAYEKECLVVKELYPDVASQDYSCQKFLAASHKKRFEMFYALGAYWGHFWDHPLIRSLESSLVKKRLSYLSDTKIDFYSQVHQLPYPLGALKELDKILVAIKKSEERRQKILSASQKSLSPTPKGVGIEENKSVDELRHERNSKNNEENKLL